MMPPRTTQTRATIVATEQILLGLAAGITLATSVATAIHGAPVMALARPSLWLALSLSAAGLTWSHLSRYLRWGLDLTPATRFSDSWKPTILLSWAFTAGLASIGWMLTTAPATSQNVSAARGVVFAPWILTLWITAPLALFLLGLLSLRALTALEQEASPTVPELAQPIAHSLLGGIACLMGMGLITGEITAELTYNMGAAVTEASAMTIIWSALSLRSTHAYLQAEQSRGQRWPLAERGYLIVALAVLFGLILPSVMILADLLLARLTGMVVACGVLAVSNYAIRFGWVLLRCGTHWPAP